MERKQKESLVCATCKNEIKKIQKLVPQEIEQVDTLEKKEHEIILYNDDVNTFDHVIECLVRFVSIPICKLSNVPILFIIQENVV